MLSDDIVYQINLIRKTLTQVKETRLASHLLFSKKEDPKLQEAIVALEHLTNQITEIRQAKSPPLSLLPQLKI